MTGEYCISVDLAIDVSRGDGAWVGYCPVLDVVARGESPEEAAEATREAVRTLIEHREWRHARGAKWAAIPAIARSRGGRATGGTT